MARRAAFALQPPPTFMPHLPGPKAHPLLASNNTVSYTRALELLGCDRSVSRNGASRAARLPRRATGGRMSQPNESEIAAARLEEMLNQRESPDNYKYPRHMIRDFIAMCVFDLGLE